MSNYGFYVTNGSIYIGEFPGEIDPLVELSLNDEERAYYDTLNNMEKRLYVHALSKGDHASAKRTIEEPTIDISGCRVGKVTDLQTS